MRHKHPGTYPPLILVAAVDTEAARTLVHHFEKRGFNVAHSGTAEETLRLAEGLRFNLAVIDAQFEDMSGIELCRRLKSYDSRLPVIMASADRSAATERKAREAGIIHYMQTPLNLQRIQAVVDYALRPASIHGIPTRLTTWH